MHSVGGVVLNENKVQNMIKQVGVGLRAESDQTLCYQRGRSVTALGIASVTQARDVNSSKDQGEGHICRPIIVDDTPSRGWRVPLGKR
jgi:hypothetical protein